MQRGQHRRGGTLRVAFGDKPDWHQAIAASLDRARYTPAFGGFAEIDPAHHDALVPLRLSDYRTLARHAHWLGRKFIRPARHAVEVCHDKFALSRRLIEAGFAAHVPALRDAGAPYPYVWKRRNGCWGMFCRVVAGADEEGGLERDDNWFAQDMVAGTVEFAAHILRVRGRIAYCSTMTYEMAAPGLVKGKHARPVAVRRAAGSPHLALFESMLDALGYEGTACIDYKLAHGIPQIMEINPRPGGTLAGDINAYLDAYVAALDWGEAACGIREPGGKGDSQAGDGVAQAA